MVALRDGRKLIGVLRSWDQFGKPPSLTTQTNSARRKQNKSEIKGKERKKSQCLTSTQANLVLQSTIERIFVPPTDPSSRGLYADIPRGIFLVRGENVLLLGEIDLDKDDDPPAGYEAADAETVQKLAKERKDAEKARGKARIGRLNAIGFEGEHIGDVLLG